MAKAGLWSVNSQPVHLLPQRQHPLAGTHLTSCQELVGVRSWWVSWLGGEAACASTDQRCTNSAGANRWRNNTIFAAVLVSRRCERASDGLCVDSSLDSVVTRADAKAWSLDAGRAIARVRVAIEQRCFNHTIAARKRVQVGACSAEVKADIDASMRDAGHCDALHPATNTSLV